MSDQPNGTAHPAWVRCGAHIRQRIYCTRPLDHVGPCAFDPTLTERTAESPRQPVAQERLQELAWCRNTQRHLATHRHQFDQFCPTCAHRLSQLTEAFQLGAASSGGSFTQSALEVTQNASGVSAARLPESDIDWRAVAKDLTTALDIQNTRNKALTESLQQLRSYVQHKDSCRFASEPGACTCGLDDVLKAIGGK